jgi:chloramphenicol 3-O phosphotransferase
MESGKGTLIILNGGSSAGKTTLGKALQDAMLPETWLLIGIDAFWLSFAPQELDLARADPNYYSWKVTAEDGKDYFNVVPGPILDRLMPGKNQSSVRLIDLGFNVIADEVIWKREWLISLLEVFAAYRVYFFGVYVSDEEGERGETARGDRRPGWDRGSASRAHEDAIYDLTIDTTLERPTEAAMEIKPALTSGLAPVAFDQLRRHFIRI